MRSIDMGWFSICASWVELVYAVPENCRPCTPNWAPAWPHCVGLVHVQKLVHHGTPWYTSTLQKKFVQWQPHQYTATSIVQTGFIPTIWHSYTQRASGDPSRCQALILNFPEASWPPPEAFEDGYGLNAESVWITAFSFSDRKIKGMYLQIDKCRDDTVGCPIEMAGCIKKWYGILLYNRWAWISSLLVVFCLDNFRREGRLSGSSCLWRWIQQVQSVQMSWQFLPVRPSKSMW